MAVTLAAAYFERGDTSQAVRVCRKAVTKAEKLESPEARASAYWNASIMERPGLGQRRGPAGRARTCAAWPKDRTAATSRVLRTHLGTCSCGWIRRRSPRPRRTWSRRPRNCVHSAGVVDIGRNELAQARAHYLSGDFDIAERMTTRVLENLRTLAPLTAADAKSLEGQVHAARGDVAGAAAAYREAVDPDGGRFGPRSCRDVV